MTLLNVITRHPGIRTNELAMSIGKSVSTISRYLKILKDNGKIEFRGAPKNGGYFEM